MRMRKIMVKKLHLLCACSLAAAMCFSAAYADNVIRVGTEATYAPFEFMDDEAKPQGYDIDIITAIGEAMGYEVQVQNMPFDGLIPALMTSQIDAVIAAMTITPERAQRVDFSEPYYKSGLSVLIREADKDKYTSLESLKGQPLCAQIGTTGAMKADELSGGNAKSFNTEPEAFMELKAGGCEGVVNDRPVNLYYLATAASEGVVEMSEMITAEDYGIAVAKGNTDMKQVIDEGLKKIRENGTFAKIHQKWFSVAE